MKSGPGMDKFEATIVAETIRPKAEAVVLQQLTLCCHEQPVTAARMWGEPTRCTYKTALRDLKTAAQWLQEVTPAVLRARRQDSGDGGYQLSAVPLSSSQLES